MFPDDSILQQEHKD
jgi:dynein heavy chain, axonemal